MKNIVLIGMMGTFKTTSGKIVAKILKKKFIDTDKILSSRFRMSIEKYFKVFGEQAFREQEQKLCLELSQASDSVISTGGGIIKNSQNIENLKKNGVIICLMASPDEIYSRIKNSHTRPLLKSSDPLNKIKKILAEREQLYIQSAQTVIYNDNISAQHTAQEIIQFINQNQKLFD
jgi:shikimate kinase